MKESSSAHSTDKQNGLKRERADSGIREIPAFLKKTQVMDDAAIDAAFQEVEAKYADPEPSDEEIGTEFNLPQDNEIDPAKAAIEQQIASIKRAEAAIERRALRPKEPEARQGAEGDVLDTESFLADQAALEIKEEMARSRAAREAKNRPAKKEPVPQTDGSVLGEWAKPYIGKIPDSVLRRLNISESDGGYSPEARAEMLSGWDQGTISLTKEEARAARARRQDEEVTRDSETRTRRFDDTTKMFDGATRVFDEKTRVVKKEVTAKSKHWPELPRTRAKPTDRSSEVAARAPAPSLIRDRAAIDAPPIPALRTQTEVAAKAPPIPQVPPTAFQKVGQTFRKLLNGFLGR